MCLRSWIGGCISGHIPRVLSLAEPCEVGSHCNTDARPRSQVWPEPGFRTNEGQTLVSEGAVEGFDKAIIRRFSWTAKVNLYIVVIRSHIQHSTREFSAVIGAQEAWRLALGHQPVQHSDNILCP